jgi:hypothetical protein
MNINDTLKQFENEETVVSNRLTKRFNALFGEFSNEIILHLKQSDSIVAMNKWLYLGLFRLLMDRFDLEKVGNLELSVKEFERYFDVDAHLVSADEYEFVKAKVMIAQSESVFKEDAL